MVTITDDAPAEGGATEEDVARQAAAMEQVNRQFEERIAPQMEEADEFAERVDEVARLIEGMNDGTLSPEYIDRKIGRDEDEERRKKKKKEEEEAKKAEPISEERMAECRRKAEELKREYDRRVKAREKFTRYRERIPENHREQTTDYDAWDMWEPSDDEDDPWMQPSASNAQFAAMEKDLNERHARQTEQRQVAERARVAGNALFKAGQIAEALREYEAGLEADRRNLHLHANAAQACLKLGCYVQAIEHCDKAVRIRDFLHNNSHDTKPMAVKVLQRRASARGSLGHWDMAVSDLEEARELNPEAADTIAQLKRARASAEADRRARAAAKRLAKGEDASDGGGASLATLRQVERLAKVLEPPSAPAGPAPPAPENGDAANTEPVTAMPDPSKRLLQLRDACAELRALADAETPAAEDVRAHARACGALASAARLARGEEGTLAPPAAPLPRAAPIRLLCALCRSDACQDVVSTDTYLGAACADAIASNDSEEAGAGAQLLYMLTTTAAARRALAPVLTDPERSVIAKLIERCVRVDEAPGAAASAAGLLGNLCLDPTLRAPLRAVTLKPVLALLARPEALLVTRAAACVGNACSDATLRAALVKLGAAPDLVAALPAKQAFDPLAVRSKDDAPARRDAALLTALANLLLDDSARAAVLTDAAKRTAVARPMALLGSDAPTVRARAAAVLARLCKDATGRGAVLAHADGGGCGMLTAALKASVAASAAEKPLDASADTTGGSDDDGVLTGAKAAAPRDMAEACARALALLATSPAEPSLTRDELRARFLAGPAPCALAALLDAASSPASTDGCAGNASLAWGELARDPAHLAQLSALQPIAPLLECVKLREGAACRNAAIALSRLAADESMRETLRSLRGTEIIGSKVKG